MLLILLLSTTNLYFGISEYLAYSCSMIFRKKWYFPSVYKVHIFMKLFSHLCNRVKLLHLVLPMLAQLLETRALCLVADTEWVYKQFLMVCFWMLQMVTTYLLFFRMLEWMIFTALIWIHGSGMNCRYYFRHLEKLSKVHFRPYSYVVNVLSVSYWGPSGKNFIFISSLLNYVPGTACLLKRESKVDLPSKNIVQYKVCS